MTTPPIRDQLFREAKNEKGFRKWRRQCPLPAFAIALSLVPHGQDLRIKANNTECGNKNCKEIQWFVARYFHNGAINSFKAAICTYTMPEVTIIHIDRRCIMPLYW